jgi:uncharacterized damage-inducible protein DinB
MPPLPQGFAERYAADNSQNRQNTGWMTKDDLLKLARQFRQATLDVLDAMDDEELARPAPQAFRQIVATNAGMFAFIAIHSVQHSGQITPLRRLLGKPYAF